MTISELYAIFDDVSDFTKTMLKLLKPASRAPPFLKVERYNLLF